MSSATSIEEYFARTRELTELISVAAVDRAVDTLFQAWSDGCQIFTCGNCGSASTAPTPGLMPSPVILRKQSG